MPEPIWFRHGTNCHILDNYWGIFSYTKFFEYSVWIQYPPSCMPNSKNIVVEGSFNQISYNTKPSPVIMWENKMLPISNQDFRSFWEEVIVSIIGFHLNSSQKSFVHCQGGYLRKANLGNKGSSNCTKE